MPLPPIAGNNTKIKNQQFTGLLTRLQTAVHGQQSHHHLDTC